MSLSFSEFWIFANKREPLIAPKDETFWAFDDAYKRAETMLRGLEPWCKEDTFEMLMYNLALHYVITFNYVDDEGNTNPLFLKYKIEDKSEGIVNSASDESSSASLQITDAMQSLDYFGLDLTQTPYGKFVYSLLCQINAMAVLL